MKRRIIEIDEARCNGCGACAKACHEGAIGMMDGKARLLRDDYCDGLGDCLPACPVDAIHFVERDAAAYDEAAVKRNQQQAAAFSGCPGSRSRMLERKPAQVQGDTPACRSELTQWPVQIKLAPINAPYLDGANLLIAADCTAFAYGDFHARFIRDHVTLIGCPKLDMTDYSEKLAEIIRQNDIQSVKVVRMEVPCCGGLTEAVRQALQNSGKMIPWQVVIISTDGRIVSER